MRGCRGDAWAPICAAVAETVIEDHRGGDFGALSLRNGDAGDSDARHVGDGHLEQEIQQLEGLAVPACQRSRGVHGVVFPVGLN